MATAPQVPSSSEQKPTLSPTKRAVMECLPIKSRVWDAFGYPNFSAVDELHTCLPHIDPADIYYSLKFLKGKGLVDPFGCADWAAVEALQNDTGKFKCYSLVEVMKAAGDTTQAKPAATLTIAPQEIETSPLKEMVERAVTEHGRRSRKLTYDADSGEFKTCDAQEMKYIFQPLFDTQERLYSLMDAIGDKPDKGAVALGKCEATWTASALKSRKTLSLEEKGYTASDVDILAFRFIDHLKLITSACEKRGVTQEQVDAASSMATFAGIVDSPIARIPDAYPLEAWEGTEYARFADICHQDNYIPKEFLIESLKTFIGAAAGHYIGIEGTDVEGRFYTVLMGYAGCGKSTSVNYVQKTLSESLHYTGGSPTWPDLGCFIANCGSQPALIKKSQDHHQILQFNDEISNLAEKFKVTASGQSFLALINQLYEKTIPPANYTKDNLIEIQHPVHFSLLGCTTPDVWEITFGGTGSEGSGFFQRLSIIASEETRTVPLLPPVEFEKFKSLSDKVKALREKPYRLPMDGGARKVLGNWFLWVQQQPHEDTGRLQVQVQRNAAHLGWLMDVGRGGRTTPAEVIERAIMLANYQLAMRRKFRPIEGDNGWAQMENRIKRVLQEYKEISRSKLFRRVNGSRPGTKVFEDSIRALEGAGCIRKEKVNTSKRPKTMYYWIGDEEE